MKYLDTTMETNSPIYVFFIKEYFVHESGWYLIFFSMELSTYTDVILHNIILLHICKEGKELDTHHAKIIYISFQIACTILNAIWLRQYLFLYVVYGRQWLDWVGVDKNKLNGPKK